MKFRLLLCILGLALAPLAQSFAQMDDIDEFAIPKARKTNVQQQKKSSVITPRIKDTIPALALNNITQSEQAFCYTVETPSEGYTGYTIDGMAITGFCGVLPQIERDIFIDEYLKNEANISSIDAQCYVQPRIMLRFLRGVDYTDVLYSSPCHSFTIFYGGQLKSFNAAPSAAIMDAIIGAYEKQKTAFVSPALLDQVLPIGVPQTDEHRNLVREKSSQQPVRNWGNKTVTPTTQSTPAPTQAEPTTQKGWNQIKLNRR